MQAYRADVFEEVQRRCPSALEQTLARARGDVATSMAGNQLRLTQLLHPEGVSAFCSSLEKSEKITTKALSSAATAAHLVSESGAVLVEVAVSVLTQNCGQLITSLDNDY